ncbi:hypothetical protein MTO96_049544 [Rhipicephalus appendiculatus]
MLISDGEHASGEDPVWRPTTSAREDHVSYKLVASRALSRSSALLEEESEGLGNPSPLRSVLASPPRCIDSRTLEIVEDLGR